MALITIAGVRALRATITMPLTGAWHCEAELDAAETPSGVVAVLSDGLTLSGAVYRARVWQDTAHVWIVGGRGGLGRELSPKGYYSPTVRVVLSDIASNAGETLSSTIDSSLLTRLMGYWARTRGTAGGAIAALASKHGVDWRVLDDGSLWLGETTWAASDLVYQLLVDDVERDRWVIASETPALRPGTTLGGRRIGSVTHSFEADRVRTEAWLTTG